MRRPIGAILLLSIVIIVNVVFVRPVHADLQASIDQQTAAAAEGAQAQDLGAPLPEVIAKIINGTLALLGAVFFALIVYAGYLWMTSRDESEQVDKAKETMRRAVIGLIIVLAAYAISKFITVAIQQGTGG